MPGSDLSGSGEGAASGVRKARGSPDTTEPVVMSNNYDWLSLKPPEPTPAQCCGGGCSPCIYDQYRTQLDLWEKAKERDDPNFLQKNKPQETEDTGRYRFRLPSGTSLGLQLGQHLVLRGVIDGAEVQRAYTPITPGGRKTHFEVLIKIYAQGLMSRFVRCWRPGDSVSWRGPFGGFLYKPNKFGEVLLLCSGTGMAPMLPIISHVTDDEEDETFVTLVVCAQDFRNVYMKNFLKEQGRFWNVRIFYVLSREQSLDNLPSSYRENSKLGRIDSIFLAKVLETCRRKPYTLVCGSVSFTQDMTHLLKQLGQDDSSIFSF
ncbi:NADH-cytochrome b5 reductase-like isoform X2 [Engystomops pustulosus]|uniref:NADH-cytochrome b5 reductase-like isoform X2 n=1 Tax=Engystomops pustulosus TaxID=76066 RepID=UPI003AFAF687